MKLIDILYCDDIRNEIYNKVSLMGLYNNRIVLHPINVTKIEWPVRFNLSTLVRFTVNKDEESTILFSFEHILNDKTIVSINGEADLKGSAHSVFSLILNGTGLPLEPGSLGYSFKIHDKASGKELLSKSNRKILVVMEA